MHKWGLPPYPLKNPNLVPSIFSKDRYVLRCRRGARVVEWTGLENRRTCKRTVGSNPTLSASTSDYQLQFKEILMARFGSSVGSQAKGGQEDAFIEANFKFNVSNYSGCQSH